MNGFFIYEYIYPAIVKIENLKFQNLYLTLISMLFLSCGSLNQLEKSVKKEAKESQSFQGLVVYDPVAKKELININGNKYFTPASNVKLFTFYSAFKTLKDSIVGLNYYQNKDSLVISGTADPTFLNGYESKKTLELLAIAKDTIFLVDAKIEDKKYGQGWAWDDYQYNYMPEKSRFPVFGNVFSYKVEAKKVTSENKTLLKNIITTDVSKRRAESENLFYVDINKDKIYNTPFVTSNLLVADVLEEKTGKIVKLIPDKKYAFKPLFSESLDSIYKEMLVESDNFIAEQLMLIVGNEVSGKYSVKEAIDFSLSNYLADLPQSARWVDGSGLSRYNLCSPNDLINVLEKMYVEIPQKQLLNYFPVAGKTGTLENFGVSGKSFIYAKSGSLSNNYNLSGYLLTKKGKLLIFSSMNNHFKGSSKSVKSKIYQQLKEIHDKF